MKISKISISILMITALFISCKKNENATDITIIKNSVKTAKKSIEKTVMNEKMCFLETFNKDTTQVSLTFDGEKVSGTMIRNPYQKDCATGTLAGIKKENGEMELLYTYMIEGINQTETKVMKIENDKLTIKIGELIDIKNNGNLSYKDAAKAKYSEILNKIECK